jgi:uncharacterized protein YndB with AHSA1/START domain
MSTRHRDIDADPTRVWAVLADGWLYALWVVGASRMREVDDHWPAVGARLHHSAGAWPLLVDDTTSVLESREHELLRLRARGWPAGEAEVVIELLPQTDGTTRVVLHEDAVAGPGRLVPKPLRDVQLAVRNDESLKRLALIVENRR